MLTLNCEPITRPPGTALLADLYCGAGGSGEGVLRAFKALGRKVYGTFLNHWDRAIEIHVANHPDHRHFLNSVYTVRPEDLFARGTHLDVLWASPECIYHSNARGGKPLDDQSRSGGWVVHKWIHKTDPDIVFVENVPEVRGWCPCIQDMDASGNLLWVHVIPLKGRTRTKRIVTTHVPFDPYPDEFEQLYWRRLKKVGYEPALKADKSRKGETFNRWFKAFDKQGYDAEYRILCAADYGVPTSRRRFILVAVRRGIGKKVVWPDATHSKPDENGKPRMGTQLWRTARECIDLTNKGQSIYARKYELADKTMFRYWLGFLRYGMKDFIIPQHQGWDGENVRSLDQPFGTITADHRGEMVGQSYLVQMQGQSTCHFIDAPINTILSMPKHYLAQPYLVKLKGTATARPVDEPIDTISAGGERGGVHFAYVQSWLQAVDQHGSNGSCTSSMDRPLGTIVTKQNQCFSTVMLTPCIVQAGHSPKANTDEAVRVKSVDAPLGTIHAGGGMYMLCQTGAYLIPNFGENGNQAPRSHSIDAPIPTITSHGAGGLCTGMAWLIPKLGRYGNNQPQPMDNPMVTIITDGRVHVAQTVAHLLQTAHGQDHNDEARRAKSLDQPAPSVTASGTDLGLSVSTLIQTAHEGLDAPLGSVCGNRGDAALTTSSFKYPHPTDPVTVPAKGGLIKLPNGQVLEEAIMQALGPKGHTLERVEKMLAPLVKMLHERPDLAEINKRMKPWIYTYYSSGSVGQSIDEPLPTIRTKEGCALAMAGIEWDGCNFLMENWFRMVYANELALCQGFPPDYKFPGNKTDQVRAIGNSVPPGMCFALTYAALTQNPYIPPQVWAAAA